MDGHARTKLAVAGAAAATFAALLASYSAFRPVRDALITDRNPDSIPWLWIGTFLAVSIASPIWCAVLARRAPRRFVGLTLHVFAVSLVGFAIAVGVQSGPVPVVVSRVFYIWSSVFNLFVVSVFWSLLADMLGPSTARQLYGPIAAGGTVGAIAGPALAVLLVGTIKPHGVLVLSALLLEVAVVGVAYVRRAGLHLAREEGPAVTEREVLPGGGAFTGIVHVARSPYLAAIVGYVLCTSCAATFLYLAQLHTVYEAKLDLVARTRYFSSVDFWTQVVALVLQTLVVGRAIRWLGPGIVLAVLPIVQAAGLSVLAAWPSLTVLAVIQVVGKSTTHGLTRPARELLFTVVSRDDKYRAKNAIDTIGFRFGDLAASWLNKGLAAIGGGALAFATIPLVAIWLGLTAIAGIGFRRRVKAAETQAQESA